MVVARAKRLVTREDVGVMCHGNSHGPRAIGRDVAGFVCPTIEDERQRQPLVMFYDVPGEVSCAACLHSWQDWRWRECERTAKWLKLLVSQKLSVELVRKTGITRGLRDGVNLPK
jgi:hypothetical protein